jgi:hypothetical protein
MDTKARFEMRQEALLKEDMEGLDTSPDRINKSQTLDDRYKNSLVSDTNMSDG